MATQDSRARKSPRSKIQAIVLAASALVQLPYYLAIYIFPARRPRASWPYKAAVMTRLSKWMFAFFTYIRLTTPRSLEGGKEEALFALAQPGPTSLYRGPASSPKIKPSAVGNIWLPTRPAALQDATATVFLHFHGGAYVVLSPRLPIPQAGARMLCKGIPGSLALCPQYRLASNPHGSFPAQLQDAVTAYNFLLHEKGVSADRIIISGDSARGHLALSLIRYIEQQKDLLPLPRALLLHSPWVDLTPAGVIVERKRNATVDVLPTALLQWGAESFTPEGMDREGPWISPMSHPFATSVPIWVQVGTAESLQDDVLKWAQAMREVEGNLVQLLEVQEGMHGLYDVAEEWGMKKELDDVMNDAVRFLRQVGI